MHVQNFHDSSECGKGQTNICNLMQWVACLPYYHDSKTQLVFLTTTPKRYSSVGFNRWQEQVHFKLSARSLCGNTTWTFSFFSSEGTEAHALWPSGQVRPLCKRADWTSDHSLIPSLCAGPDRTICVCELCLASPASTKAVLPRVRICFNLKGVSLCNDGCHAWRDPEPCHTVHTPGETREREQGLQENVWQRPVERVPCVKITRGVTRGSSCTSFHSRPTRIRRN